MANQWSLDTHGDPLSTVHALIRHVWNQSSLDGMLVTMDGAADPHAAPRLITDPADIDQVNPFRPLMEVNAARLIPGLLADRPQARLAALLRPCEMRALLEITKHTSLRIDRLLTISVDCLGTLASDEYQWRLERLQQGLPSEDTSDALAHEALKFARQGGIIPYRYRRACQVCSSPAAHNADFNLHVLGLPVRQKMLVAVEPPLAASVGMDGYANGTASPALVSQHERVVSRMIERHARVMERLNEALSTILPADVDALIRQLEACGDCRRCMEVCPIGSADPPQRDEHGHYDRAGVMRWLISCAGCGMCEQSCPRALPTAAIFAVIRQQLDQQWDYTPGRSLDEPLPLI